MKIFLFIVLLSSSIKAQETFQLFTKFIPESYRESPDYITTVNTILNSIPEINTDLFYYFIESLKIDEKNHSARMFKKVIKYISYEKYKNDSLYNQWQTKQIERINESNLEEDIKIKACSHFTLNGPIDNKAAPLDLYPLGVDSNKISFYKMIYYTSSYDNAYDSTINYKNKIENYENGIINEFRMEHGIIKEGAYSQLSGNAIFDKMKKYWQLLFNRISNDDNLNEIVVDYYSVNYSLDEKMHKYELSLFYNQNSLPQFSHSATTETPLIISLNEKIITNQIGLSLGYQFQLKKQKSIFSTINISLSYAYGKVNVSRKLDDIDNGFYGIEEDIMTSAIYSVQFLNSEFKANTLNYIDIGISTPIYYLSPELLISFGSNLYLTLLDYELGYDYEATSTLITKSIKTKKILAKKTSKNFGYYYSKSISSSLGITPFILVEYLLMEKINVGLSLGLRSNSLLIKMKF